MKTGIRAALIVVAASCAVAGCTDSSDSAESPSNATIEPRTIVGRGSPAPIGEQITASNAARLRVVQDLNAEATQSSTERFRWIDPSTGSWLVLDGAGYSVVDSTGQIVASAIEDRVVLANKDGVRPVTGCDLKDEASPRLVFTDNNARLVVAPLGLNRETVTCDIDIATASASKERRSGTMCEVDDEPVFTTTTVTSWEVLETSDGRWGVFKSSCGPSSPGSDAERLAAWTFPFGRYNGRNWVLSANGNIAVKVVDNGEVVRATPEGVAVISSVEPALQYSVKSISPNAKYALLSVSSGELLLLHLTAPGDPIPLASGKASWVGPDRIAYRTSSLDNSAAGPEALVVQRLSERLEEVERVRPVKGVRQDGTLRLADDSIYDVVTGNIDATDAVKRTVTEDARGSDTYRIGTGLIFASADDRDRSDSRKQTVARVDEDGKRTWSTTLDFERGDPLVAVSGDGDLIAVSGPMRITVLSGDTGKVLVVVPLQETPTLGIAFAANDRAITTGAEVIAIGAPSAKP
jgi:hypothetical protein